MKPCVRYACVVLLLFPAMSLAAEAGNRTGDGMVLVYLFLATCGLIVLLQLLPALAIIFALFKGAFGKRQETKPVSVKQR